VEDADRVSNFRKVRRAGVGGHRVGHISLVIAARAASPYPVRAKGT
jgi:hypothetical protein